MQESDYKSGALPPGGIQTNRPQNRLTDGKWPLLQNLTRLVDGQVSPRFGYGQPLSNPGGGLIHTIMRINNISVDTSPDYYLIGAGTNLYYGATVASLTLLDTGFSGNPLSVIPYRPLQSPNVWVYVFDVTKFAKYNITDTAGTPTIQGIGIGAPNLPPTVELSPPFFLIVQDTPTTGGWSASGIASSIASVSRVPASTTLSAIVYDNITGSDVNWASIGFSNPSNDYSFLGTGAMMTFNASQVNEETVPVEEIFLTLSSTTIASIFYVSGTTGDCCIQMATPFPVLQRNQLLYLGGAEYVRVVSVINGPTGLPAFLCHTLSTHVVGETITSPPSARVHFTLIHTAGETITASALQFTCTLAAQTSSGIGYVSHATAVDLTQIDGQPLGPQDYLHISVKLDNPANLIEGRLYLNTSTTTSDFSQNGYYLSFSPSQFSGSNVSGSITTLASRQAALIAENINQSELSVYNTNKANQQVETFGQTSSVVGNQSPLSQLPEPFSAYANTGDGAWTEIFIPYSAMIPIGSDNTTYLNAVNVVGVWLNVLGTVTAQFTAIWVGGSYGPDCVPALNGIGYQYPAYLYRSRFRSSVTGAISPPSAANYGGIVSRRNQIIVSPSMSPDPQVDKVDIERLGGTAFDAFHYVGTIPNNPLVEQSLLDSLLDSAIKLDETFAEDAYQPFAVDDLPRSGMCNTSGVLVEYVSGDAFNNSWAAGTEIIINNVAYTINSPPTPNLLFIIESAGAQTNVPFLIPQPTLLGQTLPVVWGPLRQRLFGCGSPTNPGLVYYTFPDNPDASSDSGWLEVTNPSEPLMNGCIYEESSIVFSTERAFRLEPSYGANPNLFTPLPLASGRGLYARYGLCVGPKIWFVGRDGLYEYAADGGSISITDPDLYNLFPHDSQPGVNVVVNGDTIYTPAYTFPQYLRLSYCNNWVYFDYLGIDNSFHTLAYHTLRREWYYYNYAGGATTHSTSVGIGVNETLIGFSDGTVGTMGGTSDNGTTVECIASTADWRLVPTNANLYINTLFTTHGLNGWQHIREMYLQYKTASAATLYIYTGDGRTFTIPLPASAGTNKLYFVCPVDCKAETFRYSFVGEPDLLLYDEQCEIHVKQWGSTGAYSPVNPFTNLYRVLGGFGTVPPPPGCMHTYSLEFAGILSIATDAIPNILIDDSTIPTFVHVGLTQASIGGSLQLNIYQGAVLWLSVTVPAGVTSYTVPQSLVVAAGQLIPGNYWRVDIVGVGSTFPGSDLGITMVV